MTSDASQVRVAGAIPNRDSYVRTDERTEISIAAVDLPTAVDAQGVSQESQLVEWVPGDAIHEDPRTAHQSGLYGFRDDSETETCACSDAAHWPTPAGGNKLLRHFELEPDFELTAFIEECRALRESQTPRRDTSSLGRIILAAYAPLRRQR